MSIVAIEINDVGLTAADDSGALGRSSPGYALLERRDIVTGEAARQAARLKPRFISHRHWDHLSLESVGRPFPSGLRHADLVHAHLSQYWADLERSLDVRPTAVSVLLAVPPSYSTEQLGLLLGIARSSDTPIPITGLVDSSLAAVTEIDTDRDIVHLDMQLHRATLSLLETGERRLRSQVVGVEAAGLHSFQRLWVETMAEQFVRQTRFDPLHRGTSEQLFYDRLPGWIAEIAESGSTTLTLDSSHSIEVTTADLLAATSTPIEALIEATRTLLPQDSGLLVLSGRAGRLPGLAPRLTEALGLEPLQLVAEAATSGALGHRDAIESQGHDLPLVLDLPVTVTHG